jgi:hypothetical protein
MTLAALLLDDRCGLRDLSGAILSVSAGVVEGLRQQKFDNSGIVSQQSE